MIPKRLQTILMTVSLLAVIVLSAASVLEAADLSENDRQELILLNWSEYIDPDLVKKFETEFHAAVKEIYFESDELKDEMLIHTDGKGYDIVVTSGFSALPYLKRKWLSPITARNLPNLKHLDPKLLAAYPALEGYSVPYTWGYTGIAYRKDLVKETVTSWNQLFKPKSELRGKIMMIEDSEDNICPALKALGYSLNSNQPAHYDAAAKLLMAQKPFVKEYGIMALTSESAMVKGDIWMAPMYNGDALILHEILPAIELALPVEGVNLWIDFMVVMAGSRNKKLALDFINFMNEPENAAQLAEYLMYATPNRSARAYLSPEHLNHPMIYPPPEVLARSEYEQPVSPRIMRKRNTIFNKLLQ